MNILKQVKVEANTQPKLHAEKKSFEDHVYTWIKPVFISLAVIQFVGLIILTYFVLQST